MNTFEITIFSILGFLLLTILYWIISEQVRKYKLKKQSPDKEPTKMEVFYPTLPAVEGDQEC